MTYKLLLIDDEPANLRMLERLFRADYEVLAAEGGPHGLELLSRHDIALIISDQRMPGMTGIEFLKKAAAMRPATVRMILTGYTDVQDLVEAVNSGVVYKYITKPWVNSDLLQTVHRGIEHYRSNKSQILLREENQRLSERLERSVEATVNVIAELIGQKNFTLVEHCRRVSDYAVSIAGKMGLPERDVRELSWAGLLHELPNMRLPFDLAFNKAALTVDQFRVVRRGFDNGMTFLTSIKELENAATAVNYQHENFDGTGLFDGLSGESIPLGARILAVANAFDEILSGRNPALLCTDEAAVEWMQARAEKEFDPAVVNACLQSNMIEHTQQPDINTANSASVLTPLAV